MRGARHGRAMRPRLVLAVLVALLAAPLAAAHEEGGIPHVNPFIGDLPVGEVESFSLAFEEGPFEAGWVFIVNAIVYNGTAAPNFTLRFDNASVASWSAQPGAVTRHLTGRMPSSGLYGLDVTNPGPGTVKAGFFYDQSCNCAAKPIPVEIPNGLVVFNADAKQGATWKATFPEPAVHALKVTLATRTNERSQWPQDFRVLQTSTAPVVKDVGAGPARLHELTWTAERDDRFYFFVESTQANLSRFDTRSPQAAVASVMVTPFFEQLAAQPKPAPGAEVALVVGALALLVVVERRR